MLHDFSLCAVIVYLPCTQTDQMAQQTTTHPSHTSFMAIRGQHLKHSLVQAIHLVHFLSMMIYSIITTICSRLWADLMMISSPRHLDWEGRRVLEQHLGELRVKFMRFFDFC